MRRSRRITWLRRSQYWYIAIRKAHLLTTLCGNGDSEAEIYTPDRDYEFGHGYQSGSCASE